MTKKRIVLAPSTSYFHYTNLVQIRRSIHVTGFECHLFLSSCYLLRQVGELRIGTLQTGTKQICWSNEECRKEVCR